MKADVYEITILGWEKHQGKLKKGHTHFLISKRFFDDHKIATSTSLERLLYLTILARCADDNAATTRPTRDQLLTMLGQRRYDIATALNHLQEKQLLTWSFFPPFINRIEKKGIEKKRIEENGITLSSENDEKPKSVEIPKKKKIDPLGPQKARRFIARYCELFQQRHGTNPEIDGRSAGVASRVSKNLSDEKIETYLEAFFAMPDSWLFKTKHPIQAFETKLSEIVVFANTEKFTTSKQAQQADDSASNMLLLEKIRRGEI